MEDKKYRRPGSIEDVKELLKTNGSELVGDYPDGIKATYMVRGKCTECETGIFERKYNMMKAHANYRCSRCQTGSVKNGGVLRVYDLNFLNQIMAGKTLVGSYAPPIKLTSKSLITFICDSKIHCQGEQVTKKFIALCDNSCFKCERCRYGTSKKGEVQNKFDSISFAEFQASQQKINNDIQLQNKDEKVTSKSYVIAKCQLCDDGKVCKQFETLIRTNKWDCDQCVIEGMNSNIEATKKLAK